MNFLAPLLLFCLFPFYMLLLGWLPGLPSFPFMPLFLHNEICKVAVVDIELQSARAFFVVINTSATPLAHFTQPIEC